MTIRIFPPCREVTRIRGYSSGLSLAKVTDATGTREYTYDIRGQVTKETVTLLTGPETPAIRYTLARSYTALGQPVSVHLPVASKLKDAEEGAIRLLSECP